MIVCKQKTSVMSPDSSYSGGGRYEVPAPTTDSGMNVPMASQSVEREPELNIGRLHTLTPHV